MGILKLSKPQFTKIISATFKTFKNTPAVYMPFFIFAGIEVIALIFFFLAPRKPLLSLLGPPIRTLWGEQFLHYPANFLLLSKLSSLARMVLSVIFGSILTGIAIAKTYKKPSKIAFTKYTSLFLIVFIITTLFYLLVNSTGALLAKYFLAKHAKLLFLGPRIWMGPILFTLNIMIGIVVQAAFIYALPELMLSDKKFFQAVFSSLNFCRKNLIITAVLIGIPMILYIPIMILNNNTALLIDRMFPEIALLICLASIIVSSLIIDPLVTISTALLYVNAREK